MTHVLNLEKKQDCYSCRFYLASAEMIFADDRVISPQEIKVDKVSTEQKR